MLDDAVLAVQEETGVGPVLAISQVVVVYWLLALASAGVQLLTRVGPVVAVEQEMLPPGVQLATGVLSSVVAS